MATKKVRAAPFLSYKFRVGNQDVEMRVPPVEGQVIRATAIWSGHGPHTLGRAGHAEYIARRQEVWADVMSKLGLRGHYKYDVLHSFTSSLVQPTPSDRARFGGH